MIGRFGRLRRQNAKERKKLDRAEAEREAERKRRIELGLPPLADDAALDGSQPLPRGPSGAAFLMLPPGAVMAQGSTLGTLKKDTPANKLVAMLSSFQLAEVRDAFNAYDQDGNGTM